MKSKKSAKGFSLLETLITIVIVGILSVACGTMLIFAYSMFEKVMGKGSASLEYKTFRFTTEKVFRNMTKEGPLIYNMIMDDVCSRENRPPATKEEEENCIKMDVEYFPIPFPGEIFTRKYYQNVAGNATTKYKIGSVVDPGIWEGHVGRSVAVYSCIASEKIPANYRRYLMTMEVSTDTVKKKMVILYSWDVVYENNRVKPIADELTQESIYKRSDFELQGGGPLHAKREVLLHDVYDFQVTSRLSNLAVNRIVREEFAKIASVRLFVKLGEDAETQYSNDFIFANKSIYGDLDNLFTGVDEDNIIP